ncbi:hypothetical protein [Paraburkholderia sp. MM6662-R1]|uniref:hypothetical protein n=1 Tax=Paraburkholderia sp. MM6662-R1 TaxID=2991066 RepID=UPI003D1CF347
MHNRRTFLASASKAATLPILASALSACGGNSLSNDTPISDAELQAQVIGKLNAELNDTTTGSTIEPYMMDVGFTWDLPLIPAAKVNAIVAYSFGNRPNAASGNTSSTGANQVALPDPGPINEELADAVHQIYQLNPVKVFAQWEIARFLVSKYQMNSTNLYSVEPVVASDGSIVYLSTDGAAADIVAREGGGAAMGTVAVVGHRDHAKRCIQTSIGRGMNAYAVKEVTLPVNYDLLSGQPWTRNRSLYGGCQRTCRVTSCALL